MPAGRPVVYLDRDGYWAARVWLGRDGAGREIRPCRRFRDAATEEEARALAAEWAAHLTSGGLVRSMRLADLLEERIEARALEGVSPNTVATWRTYLRCYVRRFLPGALADALTPVDMERFKMLLLTRGGAKGQPLSRSTVTGVLRFLRASYDHFVRIGACASNPLLSVGMPADDRPEAVSVEGADLVRLKAGLEADLEVGGPDDLRRAALALGAWISLETGMRRGEVCALRRCDVVGRQGALRVRGTMVRDGGRWTRRDSTKGGRSRSVSLAPADMERLRAWMGAQDRLIGGMGGPSPLVSADGSFMRPPALTDSFRERRRALGLPPQVTFHTLRHTHATELIMAGVDAKTVSERLGHADVATTLRIYGHVLQGRDQEAARVFAEGTAT